MIGTIPIFVDFCWLCYGTHRKVVILVDSSCDYCKGCISMFVSGYVTGDFLYFESLSIKLLFVAGKFVFDLSD